MKKGLIFDFDGLIVETELPIFQSWQELYRSYGCELLLDDWTKIIGTAEAIFNPTTELERQVGHKLDWETLEPERRARELELIAAMPVLPGVAETIVMGRSMGLKTGLASSSPCSWVTGHLARLGLVQYFDCIIASDDVFRTKPDPELFLSALEALGLQPDEAIVFEDSPNGVLAARRAGTWVVAVPSALTQKLNFGEVHLRLDTMADLQLPELLEKLQSNGQLT